MRLLLLLLCAMMVPVLVSAQNDSITNATDAFDEMLESSTRSNPSTELMSYWRTFKFRFTMQCALVFVVLLCIMLLCFFPDEPLFDITYNKYDANEIALIVSASTMRLSKREPLSMNKSGKNDEP